MITIRQALQNILDAVYGEEVRTSIHDAIYLINQIVGIKFGHGVPSAEGYEDREVYFDQNTFMMYQMVDGVWEEKGSIAGNGIETIEKTGTSGLTDTYTITFTRGTPTTFEVTNGNSIVSIEKTATNLLTDTYTITYKDGTTQDYEVVNGRGISNIVKKTTTGLVDTYEITYTDNTSSEFSIENGNGIDNIAKTGTDDNVDVYTIYYTNGTTETFSVYNGLDGRGISTVSEISHIGRVHRFKMLFTDNTEYIFEILDGESGEGTGDMLKSVYDKNDDGVVDAADELYGAANNEVLKGLDVDARGNLTLDGHAIASGGSILHVYTTDFMGMDVRITNADPYTGEVEEINGTFDQNGLCTVNITKVGNVTATVVDGTETYTASVNAPYYGIFKISLNRGEVVNVTISIDNDELFTSAVVTCVDETDSTRNQSVTMTKNVRTASFAVPTGDTYHIEYGAVNYYANPANTSSKVAVMSTVTNYSATYEFLMEKVTVELSSETGNPVSVSNRTIILHDVTSGETDSKKSDADGKQVFYVEHNHEFYFTYEDIPLYSNTPSIHYTAVKNTTRTVTFEYEYIMGQAEVTLTADTVLELSNKVVTLHDVTAGQNKAAVTDDNGVAVINVEQNHEYYVTAQDIPLNYVAPSPHYTAVKGHTDNITLRYEYVMEAVNVHVTKNGGSLDLEGISVKAYDSSDDSELAAGTTDASGNVSFNIMQNNVYYVKAETEDFYLNSKSENYTAVRGNTRDITLEYDYNAEDITVTLSTDTQSLDVTTNSVTLYDITTSVPTTKAAVNGVATFNVLAGHQYYIEAEDVTNFVQEKTPANSASSPITATKQGTKAIGLEYKIFTATIVATYPDGSTCVLKKNGVTLETASSNPHTFTVHETGTYVVEATDGADQTTQSEVAVDTYGQATSIELNYGWLVGMIVHEDTATPNARVELIEDATGWSFATMNMSTHMYDLGGFANWKWLEDVYPAMVHSNGVEDYKLDPTNYAKKIDGVTNSDVTNTSYDGGAFCKIPKLYVYQRTSGSDRYVYFGSNRNIMKDRLHITDNDFEANGFVDKLTGTDVENEHVWIPMFYGTNVNGKLKSLATGYPLAKDGGTANEFTYITAVNANRAAFFGGSIVETLIDICTMMFGSTDSQASIGRGYNTGGGDGKLKNNAVIGAGQDGLFYGSNDNGSLNKIFHSIVLGSYQAWVRDPYLVQSSGKIWVAPHYTNNPVKADNDTPTTARGYVDTGITKGASSVWMYIKKKLNIIKGWGAFSSDDGATDATYYADGSSYNSSGVRVSLRFGTCSHAAIDGLSAVNLGSVPSHSYWGIGASLLLFPPVTP